jgi:non-ribosomal peptide synthetase component F
MALTRQLHRLAEEHGLTKSALYLAAFARVLAGITSSREIVTAVATNHAAAGHAASASICAPLRVDLAGKEWITLAHGIFSWQQSQAIT